ncbi:MAG TPA: protein-glutamate O-methyltransferase CheR [Longimicrobiales bacterium]|nr:protein-glutamate O-methyltransferase CheR [Longimicrobiales bacterium]
MRSGETASRPLAAAGLHPLAVRELTEAEIREFADLKRHIEAGGFRCGGYKDRCLRRRIAVRMRACGSQTFAEYAELLSTDPAEHQRLLDVVTINVSKFFRNAEVWRAVEAHVVPRLFELDVPEVRIWSAGCAAGEEPYTLAIVLHEYAERHGLRHRLDRFRIHGTDIDGESLRTAARAEFNDFALAETPPAVRERWFESGRVFRLRPEIQRRVTFGTLDLLRSPFPAGQHLIICRNVIIYLERAVQDELFQRFRSALAPDGFLVLGKVETLFGPAAPAFHAVANRERIFRAV